VLRQTQNPWRGSLLPLACEAGAKPADGVCLAKRFGGRSAPQREQAPSPQIATHSAIKIIEMKREIFGLLHDELEEAH